VTQRVIIEEAIAKAKMTIHLPATCLMFAAWGQALILVPSRLLPDLYTYMSMAIAISAWPMAWAYRAYMTPRWKLWAYSGAGNVQQMKDAAIAAKVIGPDNGFAEKSEICSKEMREQILKLEGRM
jgi:hypothetical protein